MEALLLPLGSAGDFHPFLGLGLILQARGHRATILGDRKQEKLIRDLGLGFVPVEKTDRKSKYGKPGWWRPERVGRSLARGLTGVVLGSFGRRLRKLARASSVIPLLRPQYEAIAARYIRGQTVVVASSLALGARIAHDRLGVPLATVHLSPVMLRSAYQAPLQPPLYLPSWLPPWVKRSAYNLLDSVVIDPLLAEPVNAFRAELGLPPVSHLYASWRHSPQRIIGLFPEWLAPPQPDWPAAARLLGFPLYDERGTSELPANVKEFLATGPAPVVFAPSSSAQQSRSFLEESVAACRLLSCRGILLTPFRDQIPASLPPDVRHYDYLPYSRLLPHAAALVHHGGIGSAAQALAAGIPQLVVPHKNDQHDNARRLKLLDVARTLSPRAYRGRSIVWGLTDLLTSLTVADHCRELSRRVKTADALSEACRLIEELVGAEGLACRSAA